MDPQPRVLLEVTWEAMEHARIDPTSLLREPVGVYVGIVGQEYSAGHGTTSLVADLVTETTVSVASGYIAYTFGLLGPTLSIDTACSPSWQARRRGATTSHAFSAGCSIADSNYSGGQRLCLCWRSPTCAVDELP